MKRSTAYRRKKALNDAMDKSIIQEKIVSVLREKDFLAKAVCLLLAVILWAFIVSGRTENLRFKIPITAKNVPFQLAVSKMSERYATILIEGRKEHLKEVSVKNIKAVVNLKNALAGEPQDSPIQLEKQQVPEDVSISLVNSEVTVTLERMEEKWVMVVPNIVGTVQKGKIVIDKIVIPDRVKISGPKSVINDVESIETDDVSVQNEAGDLQLQVALKKDKSGDVTCDEISVTVKVVIADLKDLVTITVPAEIQNINRDYEDEIKDMEI